ncbi:hypothetical protein PCANB_001974 [Pneumocystis canis]|nr:hypothetical protein PCANB_001974 [Pneumocystis canis]
MIFKNKENKREYPFDDKKNERKPKQSSMTSFFGLKNVNQTTITTKFNKQLWIQGLTENQKELLKLEIECLHESWLNIYSWSHYTPLSTVKVVILGQDPYHNYNQAHGLCFSVRPPTQSPPSLRNIFIALQNDYPSFNIPKNGLLTPWAKRGVLLLNSSLTVRAHQAGSHAQKGWEEFTSKIIQAVQKCRVNGVVFLAWGSPACKRVENIDEKIHLVLKSVHPSPLSANKGFFNCGHFKKANEWLFKKYGEDGIIDWNCLNTEQITDSSKISTSILNDHTNLKTDISEIYLNSKNKEISQEEITTPSISRDELTAMESSITLEELDNSLSSDDSKSEEK